LGEISKKKAYKKLSTEASQIPLTFNEKIITKMATDRRDILKVFADKWLVRDYVRNCIGDTYLPLAYAYSNESLTEIPTNIPNEYVVKATHTSGGSVLVWNGADRDNHLPRVKRGNLGRFRLNPESINENQLIKLVNSWLDIDFSWNLTLHRPEWAYDGIPRGILFEELLLENGKIPQDYKFFVCNGAVKIIRIDSPDQMGKKQMNHFNWKWEKINVDFMGLRRERYSQSQKEIEKPSNLQDLVGVAEALSGGIDFVRVDLYNVAGHIYFGELTNYPSAGRGHYLPEAFNYELGSFLKLDDVSKHFL
jgi:hypothetical protein